ncbi:MAG: adenosyl-hopene transferase HpnH [Armatimonadota bacterium]
MRFPIGLTTTLASYIARKKLSGERFVPLVLMLEPLFACNLTCSGCGRIREYKNLQSQRLSVDECLDASEECEAPVVSVCGGEPLIHPDVAEIVDGLLQMRRYVYLCTNGTLITRSLHRFTPSNRLLFNVHIDGPREVHDIIVQREGAFDAAVSGIRAAVSEGFKVTVNTTVYKQTDMQQIDDMMNDLEDIGVECFMLSPAYSYSAVDDKEWFMSRADIAAKFADIDALAARHTLADTPVYLEFLKGQRELRCTAWGNPTRNVAGWRSPCYLIADRHYQSYRELIASTDWGSYGAGRDPRCRDCMVHCGYEPTAALMVDRQKGDLYKMLRWQMSGKVAANR